MNSISKPILFIDRDGTIVHETEDEKVDTLEKISFLKDVLHFLHLIQKNTPYHLVMVSNQDGLGSESFPYSQFYPGHNFIMRILESHGILFDKVHIDEHWEYENHPNRKPGTGMLKEYFDTEKYDLSNSYVIGDRVTDVKLARNLGCKAIHITPAKNTDAEFSTTSWKEIYEYLVLPVRKSEVYRKTNETVIHIQLSLDGTGHTDIRTGLSFFDHMLDQLGRHGGMDLSIKVIGDLHVDEHHTIEDTALALGQALYEAIKNKKGLSRYGFSLPMDDALANVAIDFGGRPWLVWDVEFRREKIGDMPTEMFFHFFKSLSDTAKCNINISCKGENEHHKIEAIFKGLARSIRAAVKRDITAIDIIPSTKGTL